METSNRGTNEVDMNETNIRLAGYAAVVSRTFKQLPIASVVRTLSKARHVKKVTLVAGSADAVTPSIHKNLVYLGHAITLTYCVADISWEAYKLRNAYDGSEISSAHFCCDGKNKKSVERLLAERTAFHALASVALPHLIVTNTMKFGRAVTTRLGYLQRAGPSALGLSCMFLLPTYLDGPVRRGVEFAGVAESSATTTIGSRSNTTSHQAINSTSIKEKTI
jgi:hypothetical protein